MKTKHKNRKSFVGLLSLTLIVAMTAIIFICKNLSWGAEKFITLGGAVSLSGPFAREGLTLKKGYDLWAKRVNEMGGITIGGEKYKVKLILYDDKGDAATSARLYEKLIGEENIKLLLAPGISHLVAAGSSVAEKHRVPMIAAYPGATENFRRGFKYFFSVGTSSRYYNREAMKLALSLKPEPKKVIILNQNSPFTISSSEGIKDLLKDYPVEVSSMQFDAGTKDFTSILLKVKAFKPDILGIHGYFSEVIAFLKQLEVAKINIPLITIPFGGAIESFRQAVGASGRYVVCETQFSRKLTYKGPVFSTAEDFYQYYLKEYGEAPSYEDAYAAATCIVIQNALEKVGAIDSEKLRDAIASTDMDVFTGPVKFTATGEIVKPTLFPIQIQSLDYKQFPPIVYPPSMADAPIVYPAPSWEKR